MSTQEHRRTRRANGEGSISKLANRDLWRGRIWITDPRTGESRRIDVYGRTKTETRAKLREASDRAAAGVAVKADRQTLAAFLEHWQKSTLAASSRRPATRETYSGLIRNQIVPRLGSHRLDQLRPMHVEEMILSMRTAGWAASTTRQSYTVLRLALDTAVRDGLLPRNPTHAVSRPTVPRKDAAFLSPDQLRAVLAASQGTRLGPFLLLIALTGMRRGEALALRWADVDLDAGTARVTGTLNRVGRELVRQETPKTKSGRRTVPLAPVVVGELRSVHRAQLEDRLRAGSAWQGSDYVFTTALGGPVDPRNALRWYYGITAAAGVPGSLHTLRHSAASMLLSRGASLRLVADVLGHSSTQITGDVYAHVLADASRLAVADAADALGLGEASDVGTPIRTPIAPRNAVRRVGTPRDVTGLKPGADQRECGTRRDAVRRPGTA